MQKNLGCDLARHAVNSCVECGLRAFQYGQTSWWPSLECPVGARSRIPPTIEPHCICRQIIPDEFYHLKFQLLHRGCCRDPLFLILKVTADKKVYIISQYDAA